MDDKQFLELLVHQKRMDYKEIETQRRISNAVFDAHLEHINSDINYIEKHLKGEL